MAQRILAAIVFISLSLSWIHFPSVWLPSREYGFVACSLALWHLFVVRQKLVGWSPEPAAWIALPVLSLTWWAALNTNIQVGHLLLTPIILFVWLGATAGRDAMVAAAPAALVFLIGVPIWELLNPLLQGMAVLFSQAVLGVLDIEATIRGTSIFLRTGIIEVADSCSGLHFLMVGLTIASCYAFFFAKRRRTQAQIVLLAAALAIFANWIRVVGLVLIGEWTQMRSPLLADHDFYGWIIFAVALAAFFPLAFRIERRDARIATASSTSAASASSPGERGVSHQLASAFPIRFAIPASALAMSGPILAVLLALIPLNEQRPSQPLPNVAELQGSDSSSSVPPRWHPQFHGAVHRAFLSTRPNSPVRIDQYWYDRQTQGTELIGGGNRIAPDSLVVGRRLVGPLDATFRTVQETVVRVDSNHVAIIWSFYRVGGIETSSSAKAKLLQIPASLRRRDDAEAILVSTACEATNCTEAVRSLFVALTGSEPPPSGTFSPR